MLCFYYKGIRNIYGNLKNQQLYKNIQPAYAYITNVSIENWSL